MKQNITVEQIEKFTGNQKEKIELIYEASCGRKTKEFHDRLPEFCKREKARTYDEWFENYIIKRIGEIYYEISVKMNIGRMIELLVNKGRDIDYEQDSTIPYCTLCVDGDIYQEKELCDALWQAVKQVL